MPETTRPKRALYTRIDDGGFVPLRARIGHDYDECPKPYACRAHQGEHQLVLHHRRQERKARRSEQAALASTPLVRQ